MTQFEGSVIILNYSLEIFPIEYINWFYCLRIPKQFLVTMITFHIFMERPNPCKVPTVEVLFFIQVHQSHLAFSDFYFYNLKNIYIYIYLFIWLCWVFIAAHGILIAKCGIFSCGMQTLSCGMWVLVPWPGIKAGPPALGAWSLSHWTTREVLIFITLNIRENSSPCSLKADASGPQWLE